MRMTAVLLLLCIVMAGCTARVHHEPDVVFQPAETPTESTPIVLNVSPPQVRVNATWDEHGNLRLWGEGMQAQNRLLVHGVDVHPENVDRFTSINWVWTLDVHTESLVHPIYWVPSETDESVAAVMLRLMFKSPDEPELVYAITADGQWWASFLWRGQFFGFIKHDDIANWEVES